MNVESVHRDATSIEVMVEVVANVEHPRGNLSIFSKEPILVATLYKEHSIRVLGFDGDVLLFHWSVSTTTTSTTGSSLCLGHPAASRGR